MLLDRVVKVRIPVAVTPEGEWFAYGASKELVHGPTDYLGAHKHPTIVYVEADVPVPVAVTVAGAVVGAHSAESMA